MMRLMFHHCAIPMLASTIVDFLMIKYVRQKRNFSESKIFSSKIKNEFILVESGIKTSFGLNLVILFDSQCDQKILKNLPKKWPEQAEKPKCLHQISI